MDGKVVVLTLDRRIAGDVSSADFSAYVTVEEAGTRIVHLFGELDMATVDMADLAMQFSGEVNVVADLADLTFMDWCGYRGLLASRRTLLARGGSLTPCNLVGQPAHALVVFKRVMDDD